MKILVFGILKERAGGSSINVTVAAPVSAGDLMNLVAEQFPDLAQGLSSCRLAVDSEYVNTSDVVSLDAEVAIIPPVSGGSDRLLVRLQTAEIQETEIRDWIAADACGGNTVFSGTVRNHHHGRRVLYLQYDAYPKMAEKQLHQIASAAIERYSLQRVAIIHRHGKVEIGQTSICVGASAAHREETFDAVRDMMNRIKADVPVWKQEFYEDGTADWVRCQHGELAA